MTNTNTGESRVEENMENMANLDRVAKWVTNLQIQTMRCAALEGPDSAKIIMEAKRIVGIAEAARGQALNMAALAVNQRITRAGTCAHPKKKLSAETQRVNKILAAIADDIESERLDQFPY